MNESIQKAKALFAPVPHVQLGFFPTPFYKLDNMSKALGVNLYIKRDDFTGMNLFGGNKIRKLEFLLGDAVAKGCKAVVTYGATQSNHAMETVSACRRCGLEPILYLTAVVKPDKEDVRANLLLDQVMGAEIHIVDIEPGETEDDAEARSFIMGAKHAAELTASGTPCYDVPMGGASHVGSIGFANGFVELAEQMDAMGLTADYVYHATGTGGTMPGRQSGKACRLSSGDSFDHRQPEERCVSDEGAESCQSGPGGPRQRPARQPRHGPSHGQQLLSARL